MLDVVEILGALAILIAFAANQTGRLNPGSRRYLVLNLAGSTVLAVLAAHDRSWGFLLLEGVWALVSLAGLVAVTKDLGSWLPWRP